MAATYKVYRDDNNELIYLEIGSAAQIAAAANTQLVEVTNPIDASQISDFSSTASSSAPVQSVNGQTGATTVTAADLSLDNVDNTSDADKPVSTAQQTALDLKYDASNPDNYQTAAQVQASLDALVDSAPGTLDTLNELAAALGDDPNFATTVNNNITTIQNNLNTEITDRTNADTVIQNQVTLNNAKVSADNSIDTHSDVDVTTVSPQVSDLLGWDGTNWAPVTTTNGFTVFAIWAEEGGNLGAGNRQWSFGNGAVSNTNITLPIDTEAFAMTLSSNSHLFFPND